MRIADCEKSSTVFVVACRDGHDCCPIEMPAMPAPRSWAERLKKPNLKNRTRSLPPRTSSQALAQRRSGAKYVASSAPSHIRMPRVGALESPQRSKWWHSDMRCGQDKRKSAASPHQSEPRVCSLSAQFKIKTSKTNVGSLKSPETGTTRNPTKKPDRDETLGPVLLCDSE